MAHQAHAIPWNTLASNYKFSYQFSARHPVFPRQKDIFRRGKEREITELKYFCRALSQQIREFATSQRAKFKAAEYYKQRASTWESSRVAEDTTAAAPTETDLKMETIPVFPTIIRDRYFERQKSDSTNPNQRFMLSGLDSSSQLVDSWFTGKHNPGIISGEALKVLMMEASATNPALSASPELDAVQRTVLQHQVMDSMLLMAHHPRIRLLDLVHMHHGHHFGVSRVQEEALKAYIYLNRLVAMREQGSDICDYCRDDDGVEDRTRRNYMDCVTWRTLLGSVAGTYDGDGQNLVHWEFFRSREEGQFGQYDMGTDKDVLEDMEALREYLKGIWRVMVTYDVVIREAGGDPEWEKACMDAFAFDLSFEAFG